MTPEQEAVAMILPFWNRAVIMPSPVDELETSSGLIVPQQFAGGPKFTRGVVMALDPDHSHSQPLEIGTVVYYRNAIRIRDLDVVDLDDILAYEPA